MFHDSSNLAMFWYFG